MTERYQLYKEGKISRDDMLLSNLYFEQKTGKKLQLPETTPTLARIEIIKDFIQKMQNITFTFSTKHLFEKLQTKKDNEIIVLTSTYLRYMLTEILGVDFKETSGVINYIKINEIYARFMERVDFQDNPEQYFTYEKRWAELTNTKTNDLVQKYPMTDEVVETILKYYFMLHPEDAYGKFLNKPEQTNENILTTDSENIPVQKVLE